MSSIYIATARDDVRVETLGLLAREGLPARSVVDWDGLCAAVCAPGTRLVLVDAELPRLQAPLLASLVGALASPPVVRVVTGTAAPLTRVAAGERALLRLARAALPGPALDAGERRALTWMGLGPEPLARLSALAVSTQPVLVHGERGTGKARVARVVHRLSRRAGPFVERRPGLQARWEAEGAPGTLFLTNAHEHTDVREVVARAQELGWGVLAATRSPDPVEGVSWARVTLAPLRERPDDLRALASHALESQCRRLGVPRRSFDRAAWALMSAHRWPGNGHELDDFVLAAIEACPGPVIRGARMPESVTALLAPRSGAGEALESFEEMARARLTPVVRDFVAVPGPSLHDIVVDAAERALFALALARTGGNRKQAAALLGVSRNTLQWRLERLGISATRG